MDNGFIGEPHDRYWFSFYTEVMYAVVAKRFSICSVVM